jgi:hypothetical protein
MNVVPIALYHPQAVAGSGSGPLPIPGVSEVEERNKRDIYYLIFDRYPGPKTFRDLYHRENDLFGFLEDEGFYVAEDALANHLKTQHSLASSLNLDYITYLEDEVTGDQDDQTPVQNLMHNFKLSRYLDSLGYRYLHLGSWFPPTFEDPAADENLHFNSWSQFSSRLLESTMWRGIRDRLGVRSPFDLTVLQREHSEYELAKLNEIDEAPGPKFVFAHVLLPHPPYVFDREGNFNDEEPIDADRDRMFAQLEFTNAQIREIVSNLLEGPDETDPIVVLQSDEGPHPPRYQADETYFDWTTATEEELGEKLRILNALYLPGADRKELYPTMSPVNTFRLIFREYFGSNIEKLPDRSLVFHDWLHLYDFTDVTERLR